MTRAITVKNILAGLEQLCLKFRTEKHFLKISKMLLQQI